MTYWGMTHLMLYSVLTFLILATLNIILVTRIQKRKSAFSTLRGSENANISLRNRFISILNAYGGGGGLHATHRQLPFSLEKMSNAVIFITVSFIVFTLPVACASSFFPRLAMSDSGLFVIVLLDSSPFHITHSTYSSATRSITPTDTKLTRCSVRSEPKIVY
jgi:hypothetical protein